MWLSLYKKRYKHDNSLLTKTAFPGSIAAIFALWLQSPERVEVSFARQRNASF
jgi:hypothetical protein